MGPAPVEDEAHFWAECPLLRTARTRMMGELEGAYPGFGDRFAALPRLEKGRALAFGVPDGTWTPGRGIARGVGARCAGGGAFWSGDCGVVPGAWAGHVAHGTVMGIFFWNFARLRAAAA